MNPVRHVPARAPTMGLAFWLRRFCVVCLGAFSIIAAAKMLMGAGWRASLAHAAIWSLISAGVFVAARIHQSRRGQHCALCRDTPETRRPG